MPCDTPPPPSSIHDGDECNDEDVDDSVYDFIEDVDELEIVDDDLEIAVSDKDDSVITFDSHKDPVFCCSFDKTGNYIVTGGQDDTAFVWNVLNKTMQFECTGHSESVIAASFSPDSKYVVTADMAGFIQLWSMDDATAIWDFETDEIQWLQWLNKENSFIIGARDGSCWKWTLPDMVLEFFPNVGVSCCTGSISHDDQKLVAGYSDGTLKLWNMSSRTALATLSGPVAHKEAVITVAFNADSSLILTGSEDGTAKILKTSDFKVLWTLNSCDFNQHDHETVSIEAVGFCHSFPYIVIGTNCGILSFWDMNSKIRRAHTESNSSIIKIICDKVDPIVYSATGDGILQAHDARTGNLIKSWHGHKAAILDVALSSDSRLLLTASDDQTCKIFERGVF